MATSDKTLATVLDRCQDLYNRSKELTKELNYTSVDTCHSEIPKELDRKYRKWMLEHKKVEELIATRLVIPLPYCREFKILQQRQIMVEQNKTSVTKALRDFQYRIRRKENTFLPLGGTDSASVAHEIQSPTDSMQWNLSTTALVPPENFGAEHCVRQRHDDIQKVEEQMCEVVQIFEDVKTLIEHQTVPIQEIEEHSEQVVENVLKANEELDGAVTKAKATRNKKWIILGIVVCAILLLIGVVLLVFFTHGTPHGK